MGAVARANPRWRTMIFENKAQDPHVLEYFNPKSRPWPVISVVKWTEQKRWTLSGREVLKPDAVGKFVASVKAGKVSSERRGAPPPVVEVDGDGIVTLVSDTFDKHVLDAKKDVLVYYTRSDECGHCRTFDPMWRDLAKKIRKLGWDKLGVVLATMDIVLNKPDEEVLIVPKLVLYPAVKAARKMKDRKVYSKPRTLENLVEFLENS